MTGMYLCNDLVKMSIMHVSTLSENSSENSFQEILTQKQQNLYYINYDGKNTLMLAI